MGCYDTIILHCPKCGEEYNAQSKSGDCLLRVFDFDNCPEDVMENVNRHAPFVCDKCGTIFKVEFNPSLKIVETLKELDDFQKYFTKPSNDDIQNIREYFNKLDKK